MPWRKLLFVAENREIHEDFFSRKFPAVWYCYTKISNKSFANEIYMNYGILAG